MCGERKPVSEFSLVSKSGRASRYRRGDCKACRARTETRRNKRLKAIKSKYMRKYYLEHPEKFAEYRSRNREQKNAARRERYANDLEYRERLKQKSRDFDKRHPERKRKNRLKSEYKMSQSDFDAMLMEQGGGCAICGAKENVGDNTRNGTRKKPSLHVDHCHQSGAVRGILCSACNNAIGLMKDSPDLLRAAAEYLSRERQ